VVPCGVAERVLRREAAGPAPGKGVQRAPGGAYSARRGPGRARRGRSAGPATRGGRTRTWQGRSASGAAPGRACSATQGPGPRPAGRIARGAGPEAHPAKALSARGRTRRGGSASPPTRGGVAGAASSGALGARRWRAARARQGVQRGGRAQRGGPVLRREAAGAAPSKGARRGAAPGGAVQSCGVRRPNSYPARAFGTRPRHGDRARQGVRHGAGAPPGKSVQR
jgi:hypothetical protein